MRATSNHRGMKLTQQEHEQWHREHPGQPPKMAPEEHQSFLRQAGIGPEEDREWRRAHGVPVPGGEAAPAAEAGPPLNPFAIGGAFLEHCVGQGWLLRRGKGRSAQYFATETGKTALRQFGIAV